MAAPAGEFTQGAVRAVQTIVRQEGVRGLFAGYGSFIIRDLPFDAIEFVAYDQLKKAYSLSVGRREEDIRGHETAVIGALLGLRAVLLPVRCCSCRTAWHAQACALPPAGPRHPAESKRCAAQNACRDAGCLVVQHESARYSQLQQDCGDMLWWLPAGLCTSWLHACCIDKWSRADTE